MQPHGCVSDPPSNFQQGELEGHALWEHWHCKKWGGMDGWSSTAVVHLIQGGLRVHAFVSSQTIKRGLPFSFV